MEKVLFKERGFAIKRVEPSQNFGAQIQFSVVSGEDSVEYFFAEPRELTQLLAKISLAVMAEFRPALQ